MPPVTKEKLNKEHRIIARLYRNQTIGDFLKELHLTERRGTGFPTIYKLMKENGSPSPLFDTDDTTYFLVTLPVHTHFSIANEGATNGADLLSKYVHDRVKEILLATESWISRKDLFIRMNLTNQSFNREKYLDPLLDIGWIEMKHPEKPTHPEQQYRISPSGKKLLALI